MIKDWGMRMEDVGLGTMQNSQEKPKKVSVMMEETIWKN